MICNCFFIIAYIRLRHSVNIFGAKHVIYYINRLTMITCYDMTNIYEIRIKFISSLVKISDNPSIPTKIRRKFLFLFLL